MVFLKRQYPRLAQTPVIIMADYKLNEVARYALADLGVK